MTDHDPYDALWDEWAAMEAAVEVAGPGCPNCERCTWNPGDDCGRADHPHCERCGHCRGRHRREVF